MTIQSGDNLYAAQGGGQINRYDFNKITGAAAYTAGRAYDLSTLTGSPVANAYGGTALVAQTLFDVTPGFGMWHGGDVASLVKQLTAFSALATAATGVPCTLWLCDFLMAYPGINMNVGTLQTFINANTATFTDGAPGLVATYTNDFTTFTQVRFSNSGGALPTGLSASTNYWLVRTGATTAKIATSLANAMAGTVIAWTDAGSGTNTMTVQIPRYEDGKGVRAFITARATTGATPHNIAYAYTDQDGNPDQANPVTVAATVSAIVPHIVHSGVAANNYGPFLPLAAGDYGIRSMKTVQLSAGSGSASTAALALVRPLVSVPMGIAGVLTEKDVVNQFPSMPIVKDGACLSIIALPFAAMAASTTIIGNVDTVWG